MASLPKKTDSVRSSDKNDTPDIAFHLPLEISPPVMMAILSARQAGPATKKIRK